MAVSLTSFSSNTVKEILAWGRMTLKTSGIQESTYEARLLLSWVLAETPLHLLGHEDRLLTSEDTQHYQQAIYRRACYEPIAKIIGEKEFWSLPFYVTRDTLDPRPESETLIEATLKRIPDKSAALKILDLGTGSGCLLLTLLTELPNSLGIGVDMSPEALRVARKNAQRHHLTKRVQFIQSNWGTGLKAEKFDLILSNPPYLKRQDFATLTPDVALYDPFSALDGGADGLECYKQLAPWFKRLLAPAGQVVVEVGITQAEPVCKIMGYQGLQVKEKALDLLGIPRCLIFEKNHVPLFKRKEYN